MHRAIKERAMGVSAKAIAQKHAGKLMGDLAAAGFQCKLARVT